jgi:hypothetical protein
MDVEAGTMREVLATLAMSQTEAWVIFTGFAAAALVVTVIATQARAVAQTRAREQSRREIAAYVAEGSIAPQDAALLLADLEKKVVDAVSWGVMGPEKGQKLIAAIRAKSADAQPAE